MGVSLTETCCRVVAVTAVIFTEVAQREAIQVPLVSGITEGAEIGVVRRDDDGAATGNKQAMELFQGGDHIGHVFDDVCSADLTERVIPKRIGNPIQISYYIGARVGIAIQADSAGILIDSAADIEDGTRTQGGD